MKFNVELFVPLLLLLAMKSEYESSGATNTAGNQLGDNPELCSAVFTSVTDEGTNGTGIVTYHNGGDGRSRVVVKDCVITGKDTVKASHHGPSTKMSTMTVTNCSLDSEPYLIFETSSDTIENMELISWNNDIRS